MRSLIVRSIRGGSDLGWILRNFDDNTNVYVISHETIEENLTNTYSGEERTSLSSGTVSELDGVPSGTLFLYILMASTQETP